MDMFSADSTSDTIHAIAGKVIGSWKNLFHAEKAVICAKDLELRSSVG